MANAQTAQALLDLEVPSTALRQWRIGLDGRPSLYSVELAADSRTLVSQARDVLAKQNAVAAAGAASAAGPGSAEPTPSTTTAAEGAAAGSGTAPGVVGEESTSSGSTGTAGAGGVEEEKQAIAVHVLNTGAIYSVQFSQGDVGSSLVARVAQLLDVDLKAVKLLYNGGLLFDMEPLSKVFRSGNPVGALVQVEKELIFDPANKAEKVQLSANGKEMWCRQSPYCNQTNNARALHPLPNSSTPVYFDLQVSGRETGCYDAVGIVTGEFDLTKRMGATTDSWVLDLCYNDCRHDNQTRYIETGGVNTGDVVHFCFDHGTFSVKHRDNDEWVTLFTDIPTATPLYMCANVCGHEGGSKLRIIDASSPATNKDSDSDSSDSDDDDDDDSEVEE